jgi:hypothetical protein
MTDPLRGVWLKIERAKEHSDSLQSEVRETFAVESNRPRLGIKFEPDSSEYVLFVNQMPQLGPFLDRCSLILGDIVHNLRSALDRLSYRLAELHTGGKLKNTMNVMFPICDSPKDFGDARPRRLGEIDDAHIRIIERFQPYNGIDDSESLGICFRPLSLLRDLTNIDKHRLPIELTISPQAIDAEHIDAATLNILGVFQQLDSGVIVPPQPAKDGAEIIRAKLPVGALEPHVEMAAYVIPQISLAEGWTVSDITKSIASVVINIVREFEPVF